MENKNEQVSHVGAWIGAALAVLYMVSPVDILPDVVPVAGWVDDILITVTGGLNLIQSYLKEGNDIFLLFKQPRGYFIGEDIVFTLIS